MGQFEKQKTFRFKKILLYIGYIRKEACLKKLLSNSNGWKKWHQKGVYFFFELNQKRNDSGDGLRVIRISTHTLRDNSKTT